ncbi:MAG: helix-turn-helix transcriptional regulator [Neisseria sp.]|nr:helix-turn-helix transcriptional regulator [Neisseria sp.]
MESFDVLERAKEAMGAKTDYELSKKLGISTASMSGLKKRKSLSMDLSLKIANASGVSLDWLLLGRGEKFPIAADDERDVTFVPLYDVRVSAGGGEEVYGEEIVQYIPFDTQWLNREGLFARHLACLSVTGDSMMPTFSPSDIVLVNHQKKHGDGVFVIRIGNALRIKRLQWLANGELRVSSDNDIYQPEQIRPSELADEFQIIGACHTKIGRVF